MIVRVLTARVRDRNAAKFESIMRQQLPKMREHEGLVYLKLARQVHRGYETVMLFEEWRDAEALHRWTGGALAVPRLLPGAEELVENIGVTHYEALDMDPDAVISTHESTEERAQPPPFPT
jgi:quinol monooxygenase YgiN